MRAVKKTCMVVGAAVLSIALLSTLLTVSMMGERKAALPGEMILTMDLQEGIGEQGQAPTLMDPFPFSRPTIRDVVESLDRAAEDSRVKALLVRLETGGIDLAHLQEMRAAVQRFRASGKPASIYSSSYGDFSEGMGGYYLASAFEKIWMQPAGMLSVSGIGMEMPFGRGLLEKIGITPHFFHREEYKTAMESFTNKEMSGPSRETLEAIIGDLSAQMESEIAKDRKIKPASFKVLRDKGLLTGPEALNNGLIDRLDYADVLLDETRVKVGGNADSEDPALVSIEEYIQAAPRAHGKPVALIYVSGMIGPGSGEGMAGADDISGAIDLAAADKKFKAIVLRVDSPGGSPSASETIRRSVVKAKEKGVPVIVSMGPVAASGGYWVAADADRIFALPATLTGSIGVIMGKFEASALWEKIGVNWQGVERGENAGLWSVNKPFSSSETARINVLLDSVYDSFLERVSEGRNIPRKELRALAGGRAYTGEAAQKIGLVDDLGGLDAALDYVAKDIGVESRKKLSVTVLPEPESAFQRFFSVLGAQSRLAAVLTNVDSYVARITSLNGAPAAYDPALDFAR